MLLSRLRAHLSRPLTTPLEHELATLRRDVHDLLGRAARSARYVSDAHAALDECGAPARGAAADRIRDLAAERDTLQARLDALTPKPVPPLSEGRRRVILRSVDYLSDADVHAPSAPAVAEWALATDVPDCLKGLTRSSVERFVSRLAAEGYLVSDAGKPMRYRVSESGRADLAGVAA